MGTKRASEIYIKIDNFLYAQCHTQTACRRYQVTERSKLKAIMQLTKKKAKLINISSLFDDFRQLCFRQRIFPAARNNIRHRIIFYTTHSLPLIGPIPWGHSGPLCHALALSSLSSSMSWTLHAACAIAIAGVRLATPGDWQCNGGSQ